VRSSPVIRVCFVTSTRPPRSACARLPTWPHGWIRSRQPFPAVTRASVRVIGSVSVALPPRAPPSPFLLGSGRTRFRSSTSSCVSVSPLRAPSPPPFLRRHHRCRRKSSGPSIPSPIPASASSQFFILCARCRSLPVSIVDASVAALPLPLLPPSSSHLPSSRVSSSSLSPWPLSTCSSCPLLLVATPLASSLPLPPCPLAVWC